LRGRQYILNEILTQALIAYHNRLREFNTGLDNLKIRYDLDFPTGELPNLPTLPNLAGPSNPNPNP
jgi:hypothetical protein